MGHPNNKAPDYIIKPEGVLSGPYTPYNFPKLKVINTIHAYHRTICSEFILVDLNPYILFWTHGVRSHAALHSPRFLEPQRTDQFLD